MNDLHRHALIKQLICACLFLSGLGLWGYANAKAHCQVTVTYYAGEPGNASGVVNNNSNLEVTTSDQNTLTNFTVLMQVAIQMTTAYRGGDSCFASMIYDGYSMNFGNLQLTGVAEKAYGVGPNCSIYNIGRPDGNQTYKGHAVNFQVPYAIAYETWGTGCTAHIDKKLRFTVIDPSQPIQSFQFNPMDRFLKISPGQVSANLNGSWSWSSTNHLVFKSVPPTPQNPICKRKVPLRVSSNTVAWDIHHV